MYGTDVLVYKPQHIDKSGLRHLLFLNIANSHWKDIFLKVGRGGGGTLKVSNRTPLPM